MNNLTVLRKDFKGYLDKPASLELPVLSVPLVRMVSLVRMVRMVSLVRMVSQDQRDLLDLPGSQVVKGYLDQLDRLGRLGLKVIWDPLGLKVNQDLWATKAFKVLLALKDNRGSKDCKEFKEPPVHHLLTSLQPPQSFSWLKMPVYLL